MILVAVVSIGDSSSNHEWFGFIAFFFPPCEHLLLRARRGIYHNVMIHSPRLVMPSFHLSVPGLRPKRCQNGHRESDACSTYPGHLSWTVAIKHKQQ